MKQYSKPQQTSGFILHNKNNFWASDSIFYRHWHSSRGTDASSGESFERCYYKHSLASSTSIFCYKINQWMWVILWDKDFILTVLGTTRGDLIFLESTQSCLLQKWLEHQSMFLESCFKVSKSEIFCTFLWIIIQDS